MTMNGITFFVEVLFFVTLLEGAKIIFSMRLDDLNNVITFTAEALNNDIADKHHLILFYTQRSVINYICKRYIIAFMLLFVYISEYELLYLGALNVMPFQQCGRNWQNILTKIRCRTLL